jgi:pimeloyl-ACP methyl ester carboxylesterase
LFVVGVWFEHPSDPKASISIRRKPLLFDASRVVFFDTLVWRDGRKQAQVVWVFSYYLNRGMRVKVKTRAGISLAAVACLFAFSASTASARESTITVNTPSGPCPPGISCNKVQVRQIGPASGKKVLILTPGTQGGAGDFTLMARELVKKVPGLQVWSVDRRTQILEDTAVFKQTLATAKKPLAVRRAALSKMFAYYLDLLSPGDHVALRDEAADGAWADELGTATSVEDLHAVVKLARAQKRKVVLGGHSLGGNLAAIYAGWDFNGQPGYSFIDGLVLIDGGGKSSNDDATAAAASCGLNGQTPVDSTNPSTACTGTANPLSSSPWLRLVGAGLPAASTGLFAEIGAVYAKLDPTGSAERLRNYFLLPSFIDPGFPVTNRGIVGYAFDRDTSSPALSLIHINGGSLKPGCGAGAAKPCDWVDGGVTPIARVAEAFGQEPANAVEWYFPRRLSLDSGYGASLSQTQADDGEAEDALGLRVWHGAGIDVPLYGLRTGFGTALTNEQAFSSLNAMIDFTAITPSESVLVNASRGALGDRLGQSHLDPLLGAPGKNKLFPTLIPFLKNKAFK